MVPSCQQNLQSDLVSVSGWAGCDSSWDGAMTEWRVNLLVGDVQQLADTKPKIKVVLNIECFRKTIILGEGTGVSHQQTLVVFPEENRWWIWGPRLPG